jgi:hypothetical protein
MVDAIRLRLSHSRLPWKQANFGHYQQPSLQTRCKETHHRVISEDLQQHRRSPGLEAPVSQMSCPELPAEFFVMINISRSQHPADSPL